MRISLTWANFASLYQGRKLSVKYCIRSILHGIKLAIRLTVLTWMLFKEILTLVFEERFPEVESLTEQQKKTFPVSFTACVFSAKKPLNKSNLRYSVG